MVLCSASTSCFQFLTPMTSARALVDSIPGRSRYPLGCMIFDFMLDAVGETMSMRFCQQLTFCATRRLRFCLQLVEALAESKAARGRSDKVRVLLSSRKVLRCLWFRSMCLSRDKVLGPPTSGASSFSSSPPEPVLCSESERGKFGNHGCIGGTASSISCCPRWMQTAIDNYG
jgi:hypothetical protein